MIAPKGRNNNSEVHCLEERGGGGGGPIPSSTRNDGAVAVRARLIMCLRGSEPRYASRCVCGYEHDPDPSPSPVHEKLEVRMQKRKNENSARPMKRK